MMANVLITSRHTIKYKRKKRNTFCADYEYGVLNKNDNLLCEKRRNVEY